MCPDVGRPDAEPVGVLLVSPVTMQVSGFASTPTVVVQV